MAWVRKRTMPDHDQIDQTGEEIPVDNSEEDDFYGLLSHAIGETHTTPGASEKVTNVLLAGSEMKLLTNKAEF